VAAFVLSSCGSQPDVMSPIARFAEILSGSASPPRVSLDRRSRPVVPGHPFAPAEHPAAAAPGRADWEVTAAEFAGAPGWRASRRTTPQRIPAGAVLEFSIGLSGRRLSGGPVGFSVAACDPQACSLLFEESLLESPSVVRVWHDRRIDLADLAGLDRALVFAVAHAGAREDTDLPVWGAPTLYAPQTEPDGRPNLILISIDTLRADHLGAYGYERDTDPFLRKSFATEGAVFERAVAAASTTGPSHMTMFTSLDPVVHGVLPTANFGTTLPRGIVTLAEVLAAEGYDTGAVTENGPLGPQRGFARGFADFDESVDADGGTSGHVEKTLIKARAWLERNRGRRTFLFVHTYEVHAPYTPPDVYADLFEPGPAHPGRPPEWDPVLYDREIRHTDDQLREFFAQLEREGLDGDTIVVITSDHGEAFLEHGFLGHGPDLHQEILSVPLMLRGPGIPAGLRVAAPVGLVDLMPTLLDLAGAPPVHGVMGRSLAPLLRGESDPGAGVRPLYSSAWQTRAVFAGGRAANIPQPTHSVRVGPRKLIRYMSQGRAHYAYYDLEADPDERSEALASSTAEAGELVRLLERHDSASREQRAALIAPPDALPAERPLDPERRERLRALGYLE
jgi:arylsulfatase A-like enzyme